MEVMVELKSLLCIVAMNEVPIAPDMIVELFWKMIGFSALTESRNPVV